MSYHQWLSSAPKHHLTSSTADGFSTFMLNTARPCSPPPCAEMDNHAGRQMVPPSNPVTKGTQATTWTVSDSEISAGHSVTNFPATASPAVFLPITPPYEIDDVALSGDEVHQVYRDHQSRDTQIDPLVVRYPSRPPPRQNMTTTSSSMATLSRDIRSGSNSGHITDIVGKETMLPSPPASPQLPTRPSSQTSCNARVRNTFSRPRAERATRSTCNDPMTQTSKEPHYWAVNCTVLKTDTMMEPGNVISPTCMVGLPFGAMVEMTLPVFPGDSATLYNSV